VTPKISKSVNIKPVSTWKNLPKVSDIGYKTPESTSKSRFGRHFVNSKNTSVRVKSNRKGRVAGWTDDSSHRRPYSRANHTGRRREDSALLNEALHTFVSVVLDAALTHGSPVN
jgi:hypothetical protein